MLKNTLQKDYTALGQYYQLKLPLELDVLIPANEPVRLLSAFVEDLSLSDLYSTYRRIRKNQASPRQLLSHSRHRRHLALADGIDTEIIAASVRHPMHVTECALAGADIATVPYKVIEQMVNHPLTTAGIEKFRVDYEAVFGK